MTEIGGYLPRKQADSFGRYPAQREAGATLLWLGHPAKLEPKMKQPPIDFQLPSAVRSVPDQARLGLEHRVLHFLRIVLEASSFPPVPSGKTIFFRCPRT